MATLANRLEKLEASQGRKGRLIVMSTGYGHTDDDVNRILMTNGIIRIPADTVVYFKTIFLDRQEKEIPADFEPKLLSVS